MRWGGIIIRYINRSDLDISNIPDNRIIALNKSIEEGCRSVGKLSPLVGKKKISIKSKRKDKKKF